MCNLYSITTNQAAIIALFRVFNSYIGNLPPTPGVFPDYPAPVVCNTDAGTEMVTMRWGMPPPPAAPRPKLVVQIGGTNLDRLPQLGDHTARGEPERRHERRRLAAGAWPRTI
jgi:putative SOS response-associated peptidase YedK